MSSLEFLAKNVEKAIEKACEELNLSPDKIKYDILSHGSSGIFGLAGVKKAKIRVHLPGDSNKSVTPARTKTTVSTRQTEDEVSSAPGNFSATAAEESKSDDQTCVASDGKYLDLGCTVLHRIVESISEDSKIAAERKPDGLFFHVSSEDARVLIGKKGQTLDAIQSLVEKIVNKQVPHNNKIRVHVDVEGYLENRKANLEQLAERMADKSKRIRKPISLGQMSAYDRRIVHLALKDDPNIRTQSRGEGYIRKLIIFPQKNSRQKQ